MRAVLRRHGLFRWAQLHGGHLCRRDLRVDPGQRKLWRRRILLAHGGVRRATSMPIATMVTRVPKVVAIKGCVSSTFAVADSSAVPLLAAVWMPNAAWMRTATMASHALPTLVNRAS